MEKGGGGRGYEPNYYHYFNIYCNPITLLAIISNLFFVKNTNLPNLEIGKMGNGKKTKRRIETNIKKLIGKQVKGLRKVLLYLEMKQLLMLYLKKLNIIL